MGGRRAPLRCGGRRCAPTALRCSGRGRAAELTTFAALTAFKQAAASQTTKRAARADPGPALLVAAEALRTPPTHGFAGCGFSLGGKARCGHRARLPPEARASARAASRRLDACDSPSLPQAHVGAARLRAGRPGSDLAAPSSAVERGEVCRLSGRPARSLYGPARSGPEPEASQPPSRSEQRRGLGPQAQARAAIGADGPARPQPCSPAADMRVAILTDETGWHTRRLQARAARARRRGPLRRPGRLPLRHHRGVRTASSFPATAARCPMRRSCAASPAAASSR